MHYIGSRWSYCSTVAQTIFAVALVLRLRLSWQGAAILLGLFVGHLVSSATEFRAIFTLLVLGLTGSLLLADGQRRTGLASISTYFWHSVRQDRTP